MTYYYNCPFCGSEHDMMDSEYPYTKTECMDCGARLECDNFNQCVRSIVGLPDDMPDDKIASVLDAGVNGDGVGVSSAAFTKDTIRSFGVEFE